MLSARGVVLVGFCIVFSAAAARAEDDPVEAVKKALGKVNGYVHDGLPTAAQAALPEAEKLFDALDDFHKEKVAKQLESQREHLKNFLAHRDAEQVKAYVANSVERAGQSVQRNIGDGRNVYAEYDEAVKRFDDQISDEMNKKLLDADTVAQLQKKLDGIKLEFKKARVREVVNNWEYEEKEAKREKANWQDDTKPYPISRVVVGWEIGCERTFLFLRRIDRWHGEWKTTIDANPDDPTLKKLCADLETQRAAAEAKISEFRKAVFAEAEGLPPGEQRDTMGRFYRSFLKAGAEAGADDGASPKKGGRRKDAGSGPLPGDADLLPKITALVDRWDAEQGKSKSDKASLIKDLIAGSDARWPGLIKGWSLVRLETSDVLKDPAKWKGKTGKITGANYSGGAYENQYRVIIEVDGVPVCGDFDKGLSESFNAFVAFAEKNGLKLGATQEYVGTVEGTCKVWQRVKKGDKFVRGDQIDGVRVSIVALKTERFAGAAGQGSSFDGVATGSGSGSGSSSSASTESSGTFHFLHRFLAWGASFLLVLGGSVALAHGISKYVPQVQEQKAKLGDYLGYAGIAFGLLGVLWFGAAAVLPVILGDVRFGSLPAAALVLAGLAVALDLARAKGKLDEKLAVTLQPIGIVVGAGCFLAALVHVVFWDKPLL